MGIRENLKSFRKKKKLTQRELATNSGVSYSMVSKLESGEQTNPSLDTLELLADALDVTVSQLASNSDVFKEFNTIMHGTLEELKNEINSLEPYNYVDYKLREFLCDEKVSQFFSIQTIPPEIFDDITKSIINYINFQFSEYNNKK